MAKVENNTSSFGLVLVAAGRGSRFGGGIPKQFLHLQGEPVYLVALRKFITLVEQAVIVVPENMLGAVNSEIARFSGDSAETVRIVVTPGGERRHESVLNGLLALDDKCTHVLVHDAARPFLSEDLVARVAEATLEYGAAVPLAPVTDTVKMVRNGFIKQTIDRDSLWKAQTPQGSEISRLLNTSLEAVKTGFRATDESILLERGGFEVKAVDGEAGNIKITWKGDLDRGADDET